VATKGANMWIVYMTIAMAALTLSQIPCRVLGLTWLSYWTIVVTELSLVAWLLPLGYKAAPSFFSAWFYSLACLSIGGVASSVWYFKEQISPSMWLGCALTLLGAILITR
jgi:uncharacterized membrane protein